MTHNIIAIDGPAASGKGTLARHLAAHLNFAHMDTGALYRAVGYEVLRAGGNPENENHAERAAETLRDKIMAAAGPDQILGNTELRSDEAGQAASKVAAIQSVRDTLFHLQRDFAFFPGEGYEGAVLDGRDIGTVICPEAPVKLYIEASLQVRAQRRLKELQSKGISVTSGAVLEDMRLRDERDANRQTAPMKPAEDAIVLDTSDLSADEVFDKALNIVERSLSKAKTGS